MKKLYLYFLNEDGKRTSLQPKLAKDDLEAAQVRKFMEDVVETGLFEVDEVKKFAEVNSAKYVETTTTKLF